MKPAILAGTLSIAVLSGSAAIAQESTLDWKPGYRWKYRVIDLWKKAEIGTTEKRVIETSPEGYKTAYAGAATRSFVDIVRPDGSHIRTMPGTISGSKTFDYVELKLPLTSGATWQYSNYWPSQYGGSAVKNDLQCVVKGVERITVPAGDFEAQRIECKGTWMSPSGWGGTTEEVRWYSAAAKWMVKQQYKSWLQGKLDIQEEAVLIEHDLTAK